MGRASHDQYRDMRKMYQDLANIYLTNEEALKVIRQIVRFAYCKKSKRLGYKVKVLYPKITFYGDRQSGGWYDWENRIRLSNEPSLYLICHELGHLAHDLNAWNQKVIEVGSDHHGVKYQGCLRRTAEYVRKRIVKNYTTGE